MKTTTKCLLCEHNEITEDHYLVRLKTGMKLSHPPQSSGTCEFCGKSYPLWRSNDNSWHYNIEDTLRANQDMLDKITRCSACDAELPEKCVIAGGTYKVCRSCVDEAEKETPRRSLYEWVQKRLRAKEQA